jgi:drug/metabolite transporter (DMT)-like permease
VVIAGLAVPRPFIFGAGIATVIVALLIEFGVGAIGGLDTAAVWGPILALCAANAWGLYSAITRRFGDESGGSSVTPLFQLTCAVVAGCMLLSQDESLGSLDLFFSWPMILAGVGNFVAYLCWDLGIRKGDIVTLSLLADFIPWLSLAATSLMLHVGIEARTIISAMVLVVGAIMARFGTLARRPAS